MSFNGSGVYTLPGAQLANGATVSATENNQFRNDVATALNVAWTRDGQAPATNDIPMGSNKLTELAQPTTEGDALAFGKNATVDDLAVTGNSDVTGDETVGGNLTVTGTASLGGQYFTPYTGFKNRIINGAMVINQRGAASVNTNASFPVDRFYDVMSTGVITMSQSSVAPAGFNNSIYATVTTADTTLTTGAQYAVRQVIEGYNLADLNWGTANAQAVAISFWVRSSITGTYVVSLRNSAVDRAYSATYTISAANTWEYKTITVAGDTSGTWLTTNGIGMYLQWTLGANASYNITANAWQASGGMSTAGAVSWIGTNGATFYITGVQLEKGSTATSFDYRPYGTELALCQRYYQQIGGITAADLLLQGYATSSGNVGTTFAFQQMRAAPTATKVGTWQLNNCAQPLITGASLSSLGINTITTSSGMMQFNTTGTSTYITLSAEL